MQFQVKYHHIQYQNLAFPVEKQMSLCKLFQNTGSTAN